MKTDRRRFVITVGARLALWAAALTLTVSAVVCIILYVGLERSLHREVDSFLEGEIREFQSILVEEGEEDDLIEAEREIRRELGSRLRGDLTFRLLDDAGRLMLTSDPKDPFPNPWSFGLEAGQPAVAPFFTTLQRASAHAAARFCSLQITLRGRPYLAQAGYLLTGVEHSLTGFRRVCMVAIVAASILAPVGGILLARRSLRPIGFMTRTARRMGAGRLAERIPRSGTGDELDMLAATLNEMLDRLQCHVRQMQQFTADAAHELRSPLTALRGAAEVALTRSRSAEELTQIIADSIEHYDRLCRIAEDLLLLARADAGDPIVHKERLRLDQAVEDVVDLYAPLATDRQIELTFAERSEIWLDGDGTRVRQLVGNLLDNAIKWTDPPGRVTVAVTQTDSTARIIVADTGVGIPPEQLERIFDRFYRVDSARSWHGRRGAGLGLAICRSIAEAHGGRVMLTSQPGCGTTATVILPAGSR
ncbi:MAG: heavy metal sensor histidine kinase [Planctomycetota bacterium]